MVGIRHERVEVNNKDTKTITMNVILLSSKLYLGSCQISTTEISFAEKFPRKWLTGF